MKVLKRLEEVGITLNVDKCEFNKRELTFYGLKMSSEGIRPTEDKCRALEEASAPNNVKELRSLLGLVQSNSRFIRNTCSVTEPLWRLTKKDVKWEWTKEHDTALSNLKKAVSKDYMAFFNKRWETELIVDASPVGLGAVLQQRNPQNKSETKIICFASKLLSDTERRYSQCEKEALAAVWACEKFWLYLIGSHFKLVTDNRAVQLIFNNAANRPPARIERWALRLTQFDFEIIHKPGNSNVADYFSRHPVRSAEPESNDADLSEKYINLIAECARPYAISMGEIITESNQDEEFQSLKKWIQQKNVKIPKNLTQYGLIASEICQTQDGVLLRGNRIIVPKNLRLRTVRLAHQGHQGIVKTKALIRSKVWFPGIDNMVEAEVKCCVVCQATAGKIEYAPLKPSKMPEGPWQQVSGDFFGPMADGTYYFVNHDDYSRWVAVDKIKATSFDNVKTILDEIFAVLGVPLKYKTDNGPPFQSYQFAEYSKEQGFTHQRITPRWPRANGEVESFMKNLGQVLRTAAVTGRNKDVELKAFLRAYRETPHSTTKVAPAKLLFLHSRTSGLPQIESLNFKELEALHAMAKANDQKAKEHMKNAFDHKMRACEPQIQVGARVLLKSEQHKKSDPKWDPNPYTVEEVRGTMVTAKRGGSLVTRNVSFFKPHYSFSQGDEVESPQAKVASRVEVQSETTKATEDQQAKRRVGRPTRDEARKRAEAKPDQQQDQAEPRRSARLKAKASV
jgi:transposase InsO family protein